MVVERRRAARGSLLFLLLSGACPLLAACDPAGPPEAKAPAATAPATVAPEASPRAAARPSAAAGLLAARPYKLIAPKKLDASRPAPLLLVLHPYGTTGEQVVSLLGVRDLAEERGFLLAAPEGQLDREGKTFWVATDACCDFWGKGGDDVAYLSAVIADVSAKFAVDPARLYAVGYSNGGFMAERLACELPGLAAIIDLAGSGSADASACKPERPVSVLKIHGDHDEVVPYEGGTIHGPGTKEGVCPAARDNVALWAKRDGCPGTTDKAAPPLELDMTTPGPETSVERWTGCGPGVDVELWTVRGAGHVWKRTPELPRMLMDFLSAHARPK